MQRLRRVCRRRCPPAQRDKILAAYRRSGLAQKEFAAQAGVGYSTLTSWLGKAVADGVPAYRFEFPGGLKVALAQGFLAEALQALLQMAQRL